MGTGQYPDRHQCDLLRTPEEFARAFGVNVKTISRWRKAHKLPAVVIYQTLGGHYRYCGHYVADRVTGTAK